MIKTEDLSLDRYCRYVRLRQRIHQEMVEVPDRKFLDLVSELRVNHLEEEITEKMEKAAVSNLEFWSALNEDHPDYQKINETSGNRMELREEINRIYGEICEVAYNEKVTSLYVNYLEAIENDEELYHTILEDIKETNKLEDKILLQDWANSSSPVMVVSVEKDKMGTIIGVNSSGALMFGYEKYELLSHSVQMLMPN